MHSTHGLMRFLVVVIAIAVYPARADEQCRFAPEWSAWSQPVNLGKPVNSKFDDYHPAISRNGLSLYITSQRPGGFADPAIAGEDIWVSQRASLEDAWETPQNLGPNINSPGKGVCCPNLSPDQHSLYFSGLRPGAFTPYDLWVSYREDIEDDLGWEPAINLGPRVNSDPLGPCAPTYFEDEQTGITSLYFCQNKGPIGDFDIFVSTLRTDGVFGRPALAFELSSPGRDTRTAIRRDGLEMFITSNRKGGLGKNDIWVSRRDTAQDAWCPPDNLGAPVNTDAAEGGPALSWDGTTLYFFSDKQDPTALGGRDLYVATRTRLSDGDGRSAP